MFNLEDLPKVALEVLNQLHAEEVEMINQLAAVLETRLERSKDPTGSSIVESKLAEFTAHVERHFELEESNMQRTAYPGFSEHQAEHALVREQLQSLVQTWLTADDAGALHGFFQVELPLWFVDHVGRFDTPTAEHVAGFSS